MVSDQIQHEKLTVVTYHYIRDKRNDRFRALSALDLSRFRTQVRWLRRYYEVVSMEQVLAALDRVEPLPPRAVLLTFDDGYAEHFWHVFPLLDELGLQGSFFVTTCATEGRKVLVPNKVHLVLACAASVDDVASKVSAWVEARGGVHSLEAPAHYLSRFARASRYDDATTMYVKRMLQFGLPDGARNELLDELFAEAVGVSEATIAEEFYAGIDQVKAMHRAGMHIGGHGATHKRFSLLSEAERSYEARESLRFLKQLGVNSAKATFAFPYGDIDDASVTTVKNHGYAAAFTVEPNSADLSVADRHRLPRLDTNDVEMMIGRA